VTCDVTVTNCVLSSRCNALKAGTESNGGFKNIVFSNCAIHDTHLAGVALEIVDGGTLDGILVSNIVMDAVGAPIFIRLGNRARPIAAGVETQPPGNASNIVIDNIVATHAGNIGCSLTGLAAILFGMSVLVTCDSRSQVVEPRRKTGHPFRSGPQLIPNTICLAPCPPMVSIAATHWAWVSTISKPLSRSRMPGRRLSSMT